jgi:predicted nuclease with TOPRIM domain
VSELQTEREHLLKELEAEKQKCHTLEQTLSDLLGKDGRTGTSDIRAEEINSISRKLATLEIKVQSRTVFFMVNISNVVVQCR